MARRRMSRLEEEQAIADAVAQRDDPAVEPTPVPARIGDDATVVLSVCLPVRQARELRALAAARGQSLSSLLDEAVRGLLGARESSAVEQPHEQR